MLQEIGEKSCKADQCVRVGIKSARPRQSARFIAFCTTVSAKDAKDQHQTIELRRRLHQLAVA
jgi:hypothetical protein